MTTPNSWLPQAAAHTSTGRVRSSNEDAFGFRAEYGIFVVCDGMGGAAGGEVASRMTVNSFLERMCTECAAGAVRESLHDAIVEANRAVLDRAEHEPGLYGMGTTLVALVLRPETAFIAHAGDSRCYLYRGGRLARRTHDHSLVDEQLRMGTMTQQEAYCSPFRSVITRAVGTQTTIAEEVQEFPIQPGDLFLLCTDGLTREISEERIAGILSSDSALESAARALVQAANDAGGRDNVTCVLVRVP